MIEVSGLSKRFGDVHALNDVSFTVPKGQIVGFLGANGAGKTTTMDILCGCIGADTGTAKVAGFDVTEQPLEAKRRLGYLPDVPPLHPEMRVGDFVEYAARLRKVEGAKVKQRVSDTLDTLSLGDVRQRLVGNLSKGYRQRVALAQALVHDPDVLVLDEPTEGLDPNQIAHIRDLIKALAGHHTIILSSHILSEVQATCDHIIIIHKGKVVQQGSYEELVQQMHAGRVYRLRVQKDASLMVNTLRGVTGLVNAHVDAHEANVVEFALGGGVGEDVIDEVARKAVEGGYGLRELAVKTKSLEDVFFQLTK
jgi:ABC-2 type transport system ATP-binding protein